jgi:hypothetical protein
MPSDIESPTKAMLAGAADAPPELRARLAAAAARTPNLMSNPRVTPRAQLKPHDCGGTTDKSCRHRHDYCA